MPIPEGHRDPFLAAVPCPPEKMPANCRSTFELAESKGLDTSASYAIGYQVGHVEDGEEVHSIVLRAYDSRILLALVWASKRGEEKMGYDFGQIWLPNREGPKNLGYNQAREFLNAL